MIEIKSKQECCGCGACMQVCPKQCITMQTDTEGFAYPRVDGSQCIDCGACQRVCPMLNPKAPTLPQATYATKNRNEEVRMKSSSGGVFTLLAERVIREGGVVFGAKFDEEWRVVHDHTDTVEGLAAFRGSKYVQSVVGDSYKAVEKLLKEGRKVLFSGTPCQVAALKASLRREYDNLLTVEVVCHGVPSPQVWSDYLVDRCAGHCGEVSLQSAIKSISLRDKSTGWKSYSVAVEFATSKSNGGEPLVELTPYMEDPFMRGFLKNLTLRPSCYHCAARQGRSGADIALADYWGVHTIHDGVDDDKGVGLVLVYSDKGADYFGGIKENIDHFASDYNKAIGFNPCVVTSVAEPKDRALFWELYGTHKLDAVGMVGRKITPLVACVHRIKMWLQKGTPKESVARPKVGILTFHWATNYGAVLQCYALQQTLQRLGCDAEVIDYKPRKFDDSLRQFFKKHEYRNLPDYLLRRKKERAIGEFRRNNLNLTPRVYTCAKIAKVARRYDILIAGSDQVMNPSFLMRGEGRKRISPTYFLGFPYEGRRVGYAVSFGCVSYPQAEKEVAARYIGAFDAVSVRENTGVDIVASMGRSDAVVMPDPTVLLPADYYEALAKEWSEKKGAKESYLYGFFIRNVAERQEAIGGVVKERILWNGDRGDCSMQEWLGRIWGAKCVLTDSFHCMMMCLKLHKPFVVVTEQKGNEGMNDRFYSLLGRLGLTHRILHKDDIHTLNDLLPTQQASMEIATQTSMFASPIAWKSIDEALSSYAQEGLNFLKKQVG